MDGKISQKKPLHEFGGNAVLPDQARTIEIEGRTSNEVKMFSKEELL